MTLARTAQIDLLRGSASCKFVEVLGESRTVLDRMPHAAPRGLIRSNKVQSVPEKDKVQNKVQNENDRRFIWRSFLLNCCIMFGAERGT